MKDQIDVKLYVDGLRNALMNAYLNYDVWWFYKEKENLERYEETLIKYNDFFVVSLNAHFVALVVTLCRIFDKDQETININSLIREIKTKKLLDEELILMIEDKRDKAMDLRKKVTIIRSNLFAHRSKKLSVDKIFSMASITPNEIKELMDVTKDILNTITCGLDNVEHPFDLSAKEDLKQMLDDLEEKTNKC